MSSRQTGLPVAHEMLPVMQGLGFPTHAAPALQATQPPLMHVPPGHAVPLPTFPVSTHTPDPELQSMPPVLHGFAGAQLVLALQGLHEPALHTPPGHAVPFILLLALTHTPLPDEQSMLPF